MDGYEYIIVIIIILSVLFLLVKKRNKKRIKANINGAIGEWQVRMTLNKVSLFNRFKHLEINDYILLDDNDKSHQIDHIVISKKGIFCIETKNYKGKIYGSEDAKYWRQYLGKEENQFLNPIKQNKSHVYHLEKILGNQYPVYSVIVFVQNNVDKIKVGNVINLNKLRRYLAHYRSHLHLDEIQMQEIYTTLLAKKAKLSTKEHVANIAKTQKELAKGICPRCNAKLVLRDGKFGMFYGCSNFPKCKFKINEI